MSNNTGPSVLFVNLPVRPLADLEAALKDEALTASLIHDLSMPMGLLYLASYIRKYSAVSRVALVDYALLIAQGRAFGSVRECIDWALDRAEFRPDIVAVTLNFTPAQGFFDLCLKALKGRFPRAMIVAGGNHATNTFRYQLQNPRLAAVILGEGEIPLAALVNQWAAKVFPPIRGFSTNQRTFHLARPCAINNTTPFPAWDLLDMDAYTTRASKWEIGTTSKTRVACIVASRGCPFRCTFCSSHTVHGRKVRFRSVENVVAEVRELYTRYGINIIMPWDDIFTMGKRRTIDLLQGLRALEIPGFQLQMQNGLSVQNLDEKIIDELVLTGMPMSALAIESGSEYVQQNIIHKRCDLEKAKRLVAYMQAKGVYVRCLFILGFAGETRAQIQETIDYAKSSGADWCVFGIASPLVGSEMHAQWAKAGTITDGPALWESSSYGHRSFDTPEISAEDLNELVSRANLEINFVHNPNLIAGRYDRAITLFRDIVVKFPWHVIAWQCIMRCEAALGNVMEAGYLKQCIAEMVNMNLLAREMFLKYRDLMSNLEVFYV